MRAHLLFIIAVIFIPFFCPAATNQIPELTFSKILQDGIKIEVLKTKISVSKEELKKIAKDFPTAKPIETFQYDFFLSVPSGKIKVWSKDHSIGGYDAATPFIIFDAALTNQTLLILLEDGPLNYVQPIALRDISQPVVGAPQKILDTIVGLPPVVVSGVFVGSTNEIPNVELEIKSTLEGDKKALWTHNDGSWIEIRSEKKQ